MKGSQLEMKAAAHPDAIVVRPARDHSYETANVTVTTALFHPESGWSEDYGEELTPEAEYGRRLQVLVIE